ncbi:10 kDa heat shock protein, mitochondrial [Oryzias melastigma]|uniref:10 kDa heat shock protein, mitochondrial n=1 Tax=Oryzias melastigma TaxID=30732 RepID=A0A834C378_ORYME|nr:10 kDa heat shock protein, mitochondrial [Oryzias melastigma]
MDSRIFLAPIGGKREVKGDIVQHCASPYGVTLRRNHRFNDKCGLYRPELSTERSARSPTLLELSVSAQLLTCYCACAIWSLPSRGDRAQTVLSLRREDVQLRSEMAFRKFLPLFDRVLVERLMAETVTKGGIMLPEKSQGKVLQATVVAVGPGSVNQKGDVQPVSVKVGEKVLLPEYGGTKVVLEDKDYFLFRDADILGKYVD